ncbi:hypothetical protein K438DRAFT_2029942 [Mycena galopus ATCC 62051]|nr:hypothetical protein K438DRAFT_2029942 [Mycena galopus ATCC 62051]
MTRVLAFLYLTTLFSLRPPAFRPVFGAFLPSPFLKLALPAWRVRIPQHASRPPSTFLANGLSPVTYRPVVLCDPQQTPPHSVDVFLGSGGNPYMPPDGTKLAAGFTPSHDPHGVLSHLGAGVEQGGGKGLPMYAFGPNPARMRAASGAILRRAETAAE